MNQPLTVLEFNTRVNQSLRADPELSRVAVRGEVSGYKLYPSGHAYFTLKDENAAVSCVLFRRAAVFAPGNLSEGMNVVVQGTPGLYDKTGRFQLVAEAIKEEAGVGDLYLRFLALKDKLAKEGLFDPKKKKVIPLIPSRIVVVTSPAGAVIRDIIHVVRRRFPGMRLILVPVPVQGAGAEADIARAIRTANRLHLGDVIIVARGGGSLEDLQPFNEEITAREIAGSEIPVISAVGHETDYTIADFASDLRAPTPSAAAELAVPVKEELLMRIDQLSSSLEQAMLSGLMIAGHHLRALIRRPVLQNPAAVAERHSARLNLTIQRLSATCEKRYRLEIFRGEKQRQRLTSGICLLLERAYHKADTCAKSLEALSPFAVLARGYAVIRRPDGTAITRAASLLEGESVDALFSDGHAGLKVTRPFSGKE